MSGQLAYWLIIALMMDNPNALWGDAVYPVVDQNA